MRGYLQICREEIEMRRALAKRGLESFRIIYLAIVAPFFQSHVNLKQ